MNISAIILILWFGLVFAEALTLTEQIKKSVYDGLDPTEHYFTYIPIAGMTNQFLAATRAMEIAASLNRTLLLPPIISSPPHNPSTVPIPWSRFFDLKQFQKETGLKVIEYHQFRNLTSIDEPTTFPCISTFDFSDHHSKSTTSSNFLKRFSLLLMLVKLSGRSTKYIGQLYSGLAKIKDEPLICVSNVFGFRGSDNSPWHNFGVHLHFETNFTNFVKKYIAERIGSSFEDGKYFAIHVRRGDFQTYCRHLFPGNVEKYKHCLPSVEMFEQKINEIKAANPNTKDYPVVVATNEKDMKQLKKMKDLGWNLVSKLKMGAEYGIFGPPMVDAALLVDAEVSIGVRYSTFFKVAKKRCEGWYHNDNSYYL